jgi:hypothetical protein
MTAADRTRECYTRCVPRLTRLRLLAGNGGGPLPPGAAAEVIISGEPGGTARVSLRAEAGHITPGRRASLVDAVLDLPAVREAPAWRRPSRSAMASRCSDFSSAARTSAPARRGAAPC